MNARRICLGLAHALALVAGVAWAQVDTVWTRTILGEQWDFGQSLALTEDNGILLGGHTSSYVEGGGILLIKYSLGGDSLWSRIIEEATSCVNVIALPENESIVFGLSVQEGFGGKPVVTLLNDAGETEWQSSYSYVRGLWYYKAIRTNDGGYAMGGSLGDGQMWVFRIDDTGDSLWAKSYGQRGSSLSCYSICQTFDNGMALAGIRAWEEPPYYRSELVVYKLNEQGDSLWSSNIRQGDRGYFCRQIIESPDHGLLIAGTIDWNYYDYWLVNLDQEGRLEWSKTYGTSGLDRGIAITSVRSGGYLLGGEGTFENRTKLLLIRVDESGDSLWAKRFIGDEQEEFGDLIQSPDGGFLITGSTSSEINEGVGDFYLVKTTPDPVSVREPQVSAPFALHLAQPYPNPFNGVVTIPFGVGAHRDAPLRLAIFDPLGRRVAELIPTGLVNGPYAGGKQSVAWDANGMPAGQYIVRLDVGNQQLSQRLSLVK